MSLVTQILEVTVKDQATIVRRTNEAISEGAVCKYHTDGIKVVELDVDEPLYLGCGVATAAAASGADVKLVTNGVVDVLVDGTTDVAIGDPLIASAGTAGECIKHAITTSNETTVAADLLEYSPVVIPLEAQTANDGTLTMCKVNFR